MVMMCAEWWAFQILIVIAGTIGVAEQGSMTLYVTISDFFFQLILGI